jgi:ABC-type phosphate/phosphonate transport system ATPase subunit
MLHYIFYYPNPKIIKFVCIYIIYVLNIHEIYIATSEHDQISLIKVGSIFFSRPEAGLTNRVHVRHYDTRVPLA